MGANLGEQRLSVLLLPVPALSCGIALPAPQSATRVQSARVLCLTLRLKVLPPLFAQFPSASRL